jgi:very-short-patch-repair endonuclease
MRDHDYRRRDFETYRARDMRRTPTDAERKLWQLLRRKIFGVRFRRQQPIGPYVVDFYCSPARLVIELDGEQHGVGQAAKYDELRTLWLQQRGYMVLRFWNDEILREDGETIDRILTAMIARGLPPPT